MKTQNKLSKIKQRHCGAIVAFIALAILFVFVYLSNFINKDNVVSESTKDPASNSFNAGKERPIVYSNKNEGTVTDSNGAIASVPTEDQWSISKDGLITAYFPSANMILSKGQVINGETAKDNISFRLIDNVSGVIAQGKIKAVNGKFAGVFDFNTSATEGRIDIFYADNDGIESSVINIPVRF